MNKTVVGLVVVIVLAGLLWWFWGRDAESMLGTEPPKEELIVLTIRMDQGLCKIDQRTPPQVRTDSGSLVTWRFAGQCDAGLQIEVDPEWVDTGPRPRLVDHSSSDTRLSGTTTGTGPPLVLTARLLPNLTMGSHKYQLRVDGQPIEYNPRADEGDLLVCPVWPCGHFDQ